MQIVHILKDGRCVESVAGMQVVIPAHLIERPSEENKQNECKGRKKNVER